VLGKLITFEGIDGSGKTTQMKLLAARLLATGHDVFQTVDPGGTAVGHQIRRILLDPGNDNLHPNAELLLFFASRAQNLEQCILPALSAGRIVLCHRFTDSTLAYQGYARGLGAETVLALDRIACRGLAPDLTLLIDLDLDTALSRAQERNAGGATDETRMDDQALEFHQKVRDAYLALAKRHAGPFRVIDGRGSPEEIAARVWESAAPHV
jgi:dTMP kinase